MNNELWLSGYLPGSLEDLDNPGVLDLTQVILSVERAYPLLISAELQGQVADGKRLSSWGAFDLGLKAEGIAAPEGFYETYRQRFVVDQPLFGGGYLYGGYKIGDGNFQPWFGERETNEGGEFSTGIGIPLLKDRTIDKRRQELFVAGIQRQAVDPFVRAQFLEFTRLASQAYWTWVAAGQAVTAQRELLELAQTRVEQIKELLKAGDIAPITRINNDQLIAARETKLIEAERKLQQAAIKLSLFWRDPSGQPIVPGESQLPSKFPPHQVPPIERINEDIARAIEARPELRELALMAEEVRVDLAQANNMMLPKLDAQLLASKDIGAAASSKGDKTPFELEVGFYGEVPFQRREARGKRVSAQGKLAQIEAKREFVVNKVAAMVQDSFSALVAASGRIQRASLNQQLAQETLELGRIQFDAGSDSLIDLNIYERAATDAQLQLIAAEADFFIALADYRAALSLDPIEPATETVEMPPADGQSSKDSDGQVRTGPSAAGPPGCPGTVAGLAADRTALRSWIQLSGLPVI